MKYTTLTLKDRIKHCYCFSLNYRSIFIGNILYTHNDKDNIFSCRIFIEKYNEISRTKKEFFKTKCEIMEVEQKKKFVKLGQK